MNTSQKFSPSPTVAENTNSLTQDWYLYPTLAGNYTIGGTIFLGLWINATGSGPGGTPTISIYERYASGTEVLVPGTGTSLGKQSLFNTPHYLNLSISISPYTFSKGSSIHLVFSIVCGSSTTCEIWYGSQSYDSRLSLPSENSMAISSITTYNYNMTQTSIFSDSSNATQRKVVVLANITDPFGAYDIRQVNASIVLLATSASVLSGSMNLTTAGNPTDYSEIYKAVWSYPSTAAGGNYSVTVSGVDNTGIYYKNYFGNPNYGPYLVSSTIYFSIGVSVPLTVRVSDTHGAALASAGVKVMNGLAVYAEGQTNASGYFEGLVFNSSSYNVIVAWEDSTVANQSVTISSAKDINITASVYYPTFKTVDSSGNPLGNAEIFLTFPNGTATTLPLYTSISTGTISLPRTQGGTWKVTVYWQNAEVSSENISVASDGPFSITSNVFSVSAKVTDSSSSPLGGVYLIVYNGNAVQGFGITSTTGTATFELPIGVYTIDAYWQNVEVSSQSVNITSSGTYAISAKVFELSVQVKDNTGAPISNAAVTVSDNNAPLPAFSYNWCKWERKFLVAGW